jgi:hypothetical protein
VPLVVGVLIVALVATLAVVLSTNQAAAQVQLQPAAATGPDPFTTPVTKATPSATPTVTLPGSSTQTKAVSGGTAGLYGGTEQASSCDAKKMISFLAANPDKGRAWASVEGIAPADIPAYVGSLTPVLLRVDTRVTNHGFSNGAATSFQAVLQTGTAVMVDSHGVPRVRCACGNPLLPPTAESNVSYTGTGWSNFQPGNVVIVVPASVQVTVIVLVNPDTGSWFGRPTGTDGGADHNVPPGGGTTPTPTPTTTTTTTTPTPTPTTTTPTPPLTPTTTTPTGPPPSPTSASPGSPSAPANAATSSPGLSQQTGTPSQPGATGPPSSAPGKTSSGPGASP